MGWRDAPIVEESPRWASAPLVEEESSAPPAEAESSYWAQAGQSAKDLLIGINRLPVVAARGAVAPLVDLTAWGMRQIPGLEDSAGLQEPVGGSKWFEKELERRSPDWQPSLAGKMAEGAAEAYGMAGTMAIGALNWAPKIRVAAEGGNRVAKVANVFTKMAEENPQLFWEVERKMALAGGAAGKAAVEMLEEDASPLSKAAAEIVGNILGGTSVTATGAIRRAIQQASAKAKAGRAVFSGTEGNPFQGPRYEEAMGIQEATPGVRLTTAEATGDPGIANVALGRGSMPGQTYTPRAAAQRTQTMEAVADELSPERLFQVDGKPASMAEGATAVRARLERVYNDRTTAFVKALDRFGGRVNKLAASKAVRDVLVAEEGRLDQAIGAAYEAVGNPKIPMEQFYQDMKSLREGIPDLAFSKNIPGELDKTLQAVKPKPAPDSPASQLVDPAGKPLFTDEALGAVEAKPLRLEELRRFRSDVMDEVRVERGGEARPKKIAILEQMRQAADDALTQAETDGVADVTKLREANAQFRRMANELGFRQSTVDKLLAPGKGGAPRAVPDELVGQAVFQEGESGRVAVRDYLRAFGDSPDGRQQAIKALEEYAAADLRSLAETPGELTPQRLAAWRQAHKEVLDELPGLKARFSDLARTRRRLEAVKGGTAAGVDETSRQAVNRRVFDLYFNDEPGKIAAGIFSSASPHRAMRRAVALAKGDNVALEGLREGVWRHIGEKVSSRGQRGASVLDQYSERFKFLNDPTNRRTLRALYSEEDLNLWNKAKRILDFQAQADLPPNIKGSDTAAKQGMSSYLTGMIYWVAGRQLPQAMVTPYLIKFAGRVSEKLNHQDVLRIVDQALLNPEDGRVLFNTATQLNAKAADNAIKRLAVRAGIQTAGDLVAEE